MPDKNIEHFIHHGDQPGGSVERLLELDQVDELFIDGNPRFGFTPIIQLKYHLFLLLDNSVKFTQQGQITIRSYIEADHLVCEVADTGIGICPDDQQFIWDEFFQVDELSSTKYRGAGLGLALVRDLLLLLDGDLSLTSEVGKGTTVTFRLPLEH